MTHLHRSSYRLMPWKNGKGTTEEIYVETDLNSGELLFRLSMATISESGPFSRFDGCDRLLCLLEGESIHLKHEHQKEIVLDLLTPYYFSGSLDTSARVASQGLDFNIIWKKDVYEAKMFVGKLNEHMELTSPSQGEGFFLLSLNDHFNISYQNKNYILQRYDSFHLHHLNSELFADGGDVLIVRYRSKNDESQR